MNNIDRLILLKEEELARYRESSKNFPMDLRRRFSVHYINMLEGQLNDLRAIKDKKDSE